MPATMAKPASPSPAERVIVLDTAAFIAGTDSLFALGGLTDGQSGDAVSKLSSNGNHTFYTVPEVIQEVRDRKARARLALLDGFIVLRPPSADALASVIKFAKATGDFSVLSMTDLKVMALCWMLEMERNGGKFLKEPPVRVVTTSIRVGRLIPFEQLDRIEKEKREAEQDDDESGETWNMVGTTKKDDKAVQADSENRDDKTHMTATPNATNGKRRRRRRKKKAPPGEDAEGKSNSDHHTDSAPQTSDLQIREEVENVVETDQMATYSMNTEENNAADEDDDNGWINMKNLAENLARDGGEEEQTGEDCNRVGCVTTDFAMQNTMLQMGLKILSVDGRRTIRKIKHFALRCHSCGSVTTELERRFCAKCGNASMHRVAFKVNKNGVARSFLNPKKQPSLRGTKYPIPMPRGGRYNRDLILCEDQIDPVKQRRLQKQREKLNVDVLDPSNFYNAGAQFDPHNKPIVIGYGRRNPNEVRRTSRRKR